MDTHVTGELTGVVMVFSVPSFTAGTSPMVVASKSTPSSVVADGMTGYKFVYCCPACPCTLATSAPAAKGVGLVPPNTHVQLTCEYVAVSRGVPVRSPMLSRLAPSASSRLYWLYAICASSHCAARALAMMPSICPSGVWGERSRFGSMVSHTACCRSARMFASGLTVKPAFDTPQAGT